MTPCQNFAGKLDGQGYGITYVKSRNRRAHRVAWEKANGPIPQGMIVRHTCDNPSCVNLEHLELGTHADNMKDMVRRGRSIRGEAHRVAKLTEEDVRQIRGLLSLDVDGVWVAKTFGMSRKTISSIKVGRIWRHISSDTKSAAKEKKR